MATSATAKNWRATAQTYNPGNFWGNLAVPGAGARLRIHVADGTPDATANASAFHYGGTKGGAKLMIKSTFKDLRIDEFRGPLSTTIDALEMGISAELIATTDLVMMNKLLPGVGTYATGTASGDDAAYTEIRVGVTSIAYQSAALIFPLIEDTTKWGIFHLYNALNNSGVEWAVTRSEAGFTPISFVGYELTSRAATDTMGCYWKSLQTT